MSQPGALRGPAERDPDSPIALGEAEPPRSFAQLLAAAAAVRNALDQAGWRTPLLACQDRFHLTAALLACWRDGHTAVLPPNASSATRERLLRAGAADAAIDDAWVTSVIDRPGRTDLDPSAFALALEDRHARPLVIAYSSGSTGAPAANPKTAGQLLGEAAMLAATFGIGADARVLSTAPAHHIYGLLFGVLVPLVGGGAFARSTPLHAETVSGLARATSANVLVAVPPHLHGLQALAAGSLDGVRRVFCSGGRLPDGVAAALGQRLGLTITEVLGSTETGGIGWRIAGQPDWEPLPGVEVDADAEGILHIQSPYLDPGAPRPLRVADRIELCPGGRFRHLGRADAIVKVGGERVSLVELEQRLLAVPGVADAAVVAVDDPGPRQHEICAAVVVSGVTEAELRRALRSQLDAVAMPRRLKLLPRLPREDSGKIQRERLLALFQTAEQP